MNAHAARLMLDVVAACRAPADFDSATDVIHRMTKSELRQVVGFFASAVADAADNIPSTERELVEIRWLVERYGDRWDEHFGKEAVHGD